MKHNKMVLIIQAAAIMLSSVLLVVCSSSKTNTEKTDFKQMYNDSVKEFIPLHPPIVVPHSWKDAK